jgi:hypothetical protein
VAYDACRPGRKVRTWWQIDGVGVPRPKQQVSGDKKAKAKGAKNRDIPAVRATLAQNQDLIEVLGLLNAGKAQTNKQAVEMLAANRVQQAYEVAIVGGHSEEEAKALAELARPNVAKLMRLIAAREKELQEVGAMGVARCLDRGVGIVEEMIKRNDKRRTLFDRIVKQAFPESMLKTGQPFAFSTEHFRLLEQERKNDEALIGLMRNLLLWKSAHAAHGRKSGSDRTFLQLMLKANTAEEAETIAARIYAEEMQTIAEAQGVIVSSESATVARAAATQGQAKLGVVSTMASKFRKQSDEADVVEVIFTESDPLDGGEEEDAEQEIAAVSVQGAAALAEPQETRL